MELLDVVDHDIENYQDPRLCLYLSYQAPCHHSPSNSQYKVLIKFCYHVKAKSDKLIVLFIHYTN